jgi:23S rRNA (uracil1939-C5)-methyltransferase
VRRDRPTRPPRPGAAELAPKGGAVRLRIERLAPGGAGVARTTDGRVVFVDATAPGDLVEVDRAALLGRRGAVGRPLAIVEAGPDRVTPPCPIATRCGGCDWMHLAGHARAAAYPELLTQLLERTSGGPTHLPTPVLHRPSADLGYRTRARFSVESRGLRPRIGFRAPRSHELVVPDPCVVLDPFLVEAVDHAARLLEGASGQGELSVALGLRDERRAPVLELRWDGALGADVFGRLDAACGPASGAIAGARVWIAGAHMPLVYGDPRPVQTGTDGLPVRLAAGGFAQPSDAGAALLASRVRALADAAGARVVELFAGSGTLSIGLARDARELSTSELDADAVACARENLALRGLDARVAVADAESRPIRGKPDVVVLDPPRTGAPASVAAIAQARPKRVVYVSCEPSTLARDLVPLARAGYELTALELVELFPQTSHVETVAVLERSRPSRATSAT